MLQNFVTDDDLKSYYPKIANYLWKDTTTYSTQISEAFDLVLDELRNRGVDARTLHLPIDLNRAADSTDTQNTLTSLTKTAAYTSTHVDGLQGFRRLVVNTSAITTSGCTYTLALQGSNDLDIEDDEEPTNWTAIGTITLDGVEVSTVLSQEEFRYYRYVLTVTGTSPSITYTIGLVETYPDRWIVWKALQIIFEDFSRERDDVWERRAQQAARRYDAAIENAKFLIDSNDDNLPDDTDEESNMSTEFFR